MSAASIEFFSSVAIFIASLGAACITVPLFREGVGAWLTDLSDERVGASVAPWLGGALGPPEASDEHWVLWRLEE